MHELGIVFHIIKVVERVAGENELKAVSKVSLELGEVSGVVTHELLDCWKWATKKTELLKHAELLIETIPALTLCEGCRKTYETVRYGRICPNCGSSQTCLMQGKEINIKEIGAY